MDEGVTQAQDVMLIMGIPGVVQLYILISVYRNARKTRTTNQLKDCNLHHTLIEIGGFVLHNLDRDNLVRFDILTLDYLSERPLPEDI